ncbi:MAG: hypothetical protein RLZZ340_491, partial [Actinomycetota bacterium]
PILLSGEHRGLRGLPMQLIVKDPASLQQLRLRVRHLGLVEPE